MNDDSKESSKAVKVLLADGRIVTLRGVEEKHVPALRVLMKVSPEELVAVIPDIENGDENFPTIRAVEIKEILDDKGRPRRFGSILEWIVPKRGKDTAE